MSADCQLPVLCVVAMQMQEAENAESNAFGLWMDPQNCAADCQIGLWLSRVLHTANS